MRWKILACIYQDLSSHRDDRPDGCDGQMQRNGDKAASLSMRKSDHTTMNS